MSDVINLGFIGLGQMGAPMAERLIGPDVRLHVYDTSTEALERFVGLGAVACRSPKDVADAAEIVFACLPSQQISHAVAFGELGVSSGRKIRIYVETSTIGKTAIEQISSKLADQGIETIDSPVSGGPPAARDGRLAVMISGEPSARQAVEPWLNRIGRKVYVLGDRVGQAQIMKIVNNLVMAANVVVASEGLVIGAKAGLNPDIMMDVLSASTGKSVALTDILDPAGLAGSFDFGARLSILDKDTALGISEAQELAVPVPVIEAAGGVWHAAADKVGKDGDMTRILEFVEQNGGTTVRRMGAT